MLIPSKQIESFVDVKKDDHGEIRFRIIRKGEHRAFPDGEYRLREKQICDESKKRLRKIISDKN